MFFLPLTGIGFVRIAPLTRLCVTWVVGATISPAALAHIPGMDSSCIWGCGSFGHHDHIAWECDKRPLKIRPKNGLDQRFGWFSSVTRSWLSRIVTEVWKTRYRDVPEP